MKSFDHPKAPRKLCPKLVSGHDIKS